jgi:hypothetical protein
MAAELSTRGAVIEWSLTTTSLILTAPNGCVTLLLPDTSQQETWTSEASPT